MCGAAPGRSVQFNLIEKSGYFMNKISNLNNQGGGVLSEDLRTHRCLSVSTSPRTLSRCPNILNSSVAASWSLSCCCVLFFLLAIGLASSAKAQQSVTVVSEIHQLVDVCRLEVIFDVNPGSVSTFSFFIGVEIDGNENPASYFQVAADTNDVANNGITFVATDLVYSDNLSLVVPQSRASATSPYMAKLYFNLPRSAPTTEFVLTATIGTSISDRTQPYSIAQHCPKGN